MTYLFLEIFQMTYLYRNIVRTELQPCVLLSPCRFVVMDIKQGIFADKRYERNVNIVLVSEGGLTMTFDNVRLKGCLQPSTLHISCTYCKASQYIQLRATHNDYSPSSTFLEC